MSDTYTKLFSSITASTIVSEPVATRWAWVTMLAACKPDGVVYGSVPGLARLANLSIAEIEAALTCFRSHDPYSRTQDNEGRRIADVDGGWKLLNHAKYDEIRNTVERAEYRRDWDRVNRGNRPNSGHRVPPTTPDKIRQNPTNPTPSASASTLVKQKKEKKRPVCPLPADFGISEAVRAWATAGRYGHLDRRLDHFIGYAKAKDAQYANWDQALQNAIRDDWAKLGGPMAAPPAPKQTAAQEVEYAKVRAEYDRADIERRRRDFPEAFT